MAQNLSILILLTVFGLIAATPIGKSCPTPVEIKENLKTLKTEALAQLKIFDNIPGPRERKYKEFVETWKKIYSLTRGLFEDSFPEICFEGKENIHESASGHILRFLYAKSETSEKEYLTYTDPKIIKKISDKSYELNACFENSRNITEVIPDEMEIHFCSYNMTESLDCAKKLYKNDADEPLLGLINFTNYFVKEFDCDAEERNEIKDTATLEFYNHIVEHKEKIERQTFFHGYQIAAEDFTKFT